MPCLVCSSEWHGKAMLLSGFGTTSTAQVSPPVRQRSLSMTQRATSSPIPGSPELKRSLFFIHHEPQPVLKKIASPGLISLSCMLWRCSAAHIGRHDLLAGVHHPALDRGNIDEMPASDQWLQFLG